MDYFQTANGIFQWLADFQVVQDHLSARFERKKLVFQLKHPMEDIIVVKTTIPESDHFQCKGIGLQAIQKNASGWLLNVYDEGGIFDPIDGEVIGDHYATTHFALLGAILFCENGDKSILTKIKRAVDFHIRTSPDQYLFGKWGDYHWDFNNYAFLETYRLVSNSLTDREKNKWMQSLKSYQENGYNSLTNWIGMRAYSSLLRHQLFGSTLDWWQSKRRLHMIFRSHHKDGCFDDQWNISRPIQYHVYTLALLHRLYRISPTKKLKSGFLSGVHFFLPFIDPDGCFNYLGRGQEQIFGYGAAIYVLEAAKLVDEKNAALYQGCLNRICNHLNIYKRNDHFPLVLNHRKNEEKFGWYDYHHLTVYNAFLGVWLGLTHRLRSLKQGAVAQSKPFDFFSRSTKVFIRSTDEYFLAIAGGCKEYLSEPSLSPIHLWFKDVGWVFSCPGGPSLNKYGRINFSENIEKNFIAPLALLENGQWIGPMNREAKIFFGNSRILQIALDIDCLTVTRKLDFYEKDLVFTDQFDYQDDVIFREFRFFNFPVSVDHFQFYVDNNKIMLIRRDEKKNQLNIQILIPDGCRIERLEKIKSVKGLMQILAVRETDIRFHKGQSRIIRFKISRMLNK